MNGDIKLKLGSLVIFRGLLKLPVIVRLTELDEINPEDTSALVYAYGAFMSELLKETPNFTEYLFTAVTEDENIYTSYRMSGKEKDDLYESMLDRELAILQNIVAATNEIDDISLKRLRGECVKEVKRLNGTFSMEDAVNWQSS